MVVAGQGGRLRYVECGVLTAPARHPAERRLGEIARGLGEVLDELRPDVIAVETVFARINPRTALALAQARGMVLAEAGQRALAVASYTAPVVKKMVTGRGRAEKSQVARMVQTLLALRATPRVDAADALALAIAHARASAVTAVTRAAAAAGVR